VIAKGLAMVYKEKPQNPVDYFAKWLLQQSSIKKREIEEERSVKKVLELKDKDAYTLKEHKKLLEEKLEVKKQLDLTISQFKKKVEDCDDLNDLLPELVEHLAELTGATACYIGKVVKPIKKI